MNVLGEALFDLIVADDVLGPLIGDRFYPTLGKQGGAYPMIVWQEIVSIGQTTFDDADGTLDRTDIQFSCYADTLFAASAVRKALRVCLTTLEAIPGVKITFPVQRTFHEEQVEKHNAQLDLTFWHNQ
jgi:hypothetical protein